MEVSEIIDLDKVKFYIESLDENSDDYFSTLSSIPGLKESFIFDHCTKLDFHSYLSVNKLSEDLLIHIVKSSSNCNRLNLLRYVLETQVISDKFIEEFFDNINLMISYIARYQKLSLDQIRKYKIKINWEHDTRYIIKNLSKEELPIFLEEFKDLLEWDDHIYDNFTNDLYKKYVKKLNWSRFNLANVDQSIINNYVNKINWDSAIINNASSKFLIDNLDDIAWFEFMFNSNIKALDNNTIKVLMKNKSFEENLHEIDYDTIRMFYVDYGGKLSLEEMFNIFTSDQLCYFCEDICLDLVKNKNQFNFVIDKLFKFVEDKQLNANKICYWAELTYSDIKKYFHLLKINDFYNCNYSKYKLSKIKKIFEQYSELI